MTAGISSSGDQQLTAAEMDRPARDEVMFSVANEIDRAAIGCPRIVAGFTLAGPAVIGVMRADDSVGGRWHRRDDGDELLVVIAGECAVAVRRSDGRETVHHAERGDVLVIPKGAARSLALHTPEVEVLFVTPGAETVVPGGAVDGKRGHR